MSTLNWRALTEPAFTVTDRVLQVPWLYVVETGRDYTHLRINCEGLWARATDAMASCGPEGLAEIPAQKDSLQVSDCPLGALIGKLGGSSASLSVPTAPPVSGAATNTISEGKAFAIGSYCMIPLPTNFIGPLFVSFNGFTRPVVVTKLSITVEAATTG